ncbi:hypothetical protein PO909_024619 [Leuciscus waleckii]
MAFLCTTLIQNDEVHRNSLRVSDLHRCTAVHNRMPRMSRRCQCIQTYSNPPIRSSRILSLKVIPAGSHCKNEEIM